MLLPGFTIEFDPHAKPKPASGEKRQLWGSVTITLQRPGRPSHAVAFRTESPNIEEFQQAVTTLMEWAAGPDE